MTTEPAPPPGKKLLAPLWHTAVLIAIFIAVGVLGAVFQNGSAAAPTGHQDSTTLYISLVASEWALVYFVWRGAKRNGFTLDDLIGRPWTTQTVIIDIVLGLALGIAWIGIDKAFDSLLGAGNAKSIDALLPQGPAEIALWLAVSLSAGFCEETVFRGYLQKQFAALTGSSLLAIVIQAAVFGAGHTYEGLNAVARIVAYGVLFGALAQWRKNLLPCIVAHTWTDVFEGVLTRLLNWG